jgi:hydroxymethylpyrimidine pyrophosphatase-like HAD family hydrolase
VTPRLVATDLDGTLLRTDGTVSDRSRAVLAALEERGVPVVIVTARPIRWMDDLWELVGGHGLAIVSNGAAVFDVAAGTVREVNGIHGPDGLELAEAIRTAVPGASFALECESGIRLDPDYADDYRVPEGSPRGTLAEIWTDPALKVLVRCPGMEPVALREAVVDALGDLATPTWSGDGLVEISAPGVTKAAALQRLATEMGHTAEQVVAFGDMPNDLPMLQWAGTSYAVSNADPSVLEAADHVAPANDDDGVAVTLTELFDLGQPLG